MSLNFKFSYLTVQVGEIGLREIDIQKDMNTLKNCECIQNFINVIFGEFQKSDINFSGIRVRFPVQKIFLDINSGTFKSFLPVVSIEDKLNIFRLMG